MTAFDTEENGVKIGDICINGTIIRDWTVEDINKVDNADEICAFATHVFNATKFGNDLNDIFGQEFHDAYYARRHTLLFAQQAAEKAAKFKTDVLDVLAEGQPYEILGFASIPHIGWEMDNEYASIRINGEVKFASTNHGQPVFVSRDGLVEDKKRLEEFAAQIAAILV